MAFSRRRNLHQIKILIFYAKYLRNISGFFWHLVIKNIIGIDNVLSMHNVIRFYDPFFIEIKKPTMYQILIRTLRKLFNVPLTDFNQKLFPIK